MNRALAIAIACVFATVAGPALAQHDHAHVHTATVQQTPAAAAVTEGVVKRVDKSAGRITIAHEPIRNLDMPRMTMAFKVKDATWLDRVKEGDHVHFVAENPNGVLTLVSLGTAR